MADYFAQFATEATAPARFAAAVVPSDSTVIGNATSGNATRGLYVGTAGNVTVQMIGGGGNVTFPNVPAGTTLAIQVSKVMSTGTAASNMTALW